MVVSVEEVAKLSREEKLALLKKLKAQKARQRPSSHPLSYNQKALWFMARQAPESPAYNAAFTARIRSRVNVPALQRAFQTLLDRHEALRTTFSRKNGEGVQTVRKDQHVSFAEIDASAWTEEELHQAVKAAYERPFDLESGPVMRVSLFKQTETDRILLVTLHHTACDGWSIWLLVDELRALYPAELAGTPAKLPTPSRSFIDCVEWQNKMLASPEGDRLQKYWEAQLSGELPVLNLPTDRTRPPRQTYQGASIPFTLSAELTQQLTALAKAEGVTLYVVLLAAFNVLLHRYTGQEDLLVGSPMAGRSQPEFARIVGDFAGPVVLRSDLSGSPSVKTLLTRTRQTVLGAIAHQDYPFPLVVERVQPRRDPSRSPLFQVMFVLQNPKSFGEMAELLVPSTPDVRVNWGGLELEPYEIGQQEGQYDLTLEMVEGKNRVAGSFKYNTDLFDAVTVERAIGHFQTLLVGIAENPETSIAELPLLTTAERQQMLVDWNLTETAFQSDRCIHQIFETQAQQTPDEIAVTFADRSLTYCQVNQCANQLANYLRSIGVGPETLVGICVERSLEMVVGLLGILKAGGAYVPLDPAYPVDRLAYMLGDSQVPVLLTQNRLVSQLPEHDAKVVCLDADWPEIAKHSPINLQVLTTPENLAYIIYTSGSTGKPKGVLVPHRGLCNLAQAQSRAFEVEADSRVLQFASFSFDASISEVVMTLTAGARLVLEPKSALMPGPDLLETFRKHEVSHVTLPPSALAVLPNTDLPLKSIIVAGEACSPDLVAQWSPGRNFFNAYGPTEATVCATIAKCTDGTVSPPIGRPIENAKVYLLDRNLQPVPVGIPGELHVGGVGVVRGYLNRPELTAQRFIANPFDPGTRLYKTGDLARYLPDGNIEFLGRIDHQVKIRGYRIELGEIEAVLGQHPSILDVTVLAREDSPGDKRLVAYIVPDPDRHPDAIEWQNHLKATLPDYMVPAANAFVILDALPLTPNGKVDRRALPAPSWTRKGSLVPPRTPVEQKLAKLWQEVLGLTGDISLGDNFFELGGHSLLAVSLFERITKEFDRDLPLATLFEAPTLEELARILEPTEPAASWDSLVPIQVGGNEPPLFLVHDADGETMLYLNLARHLGSDRPVYGLRPDGDEHHPIRHTRIEEMAAHYVEKMREVQPHGPYHVGGLCAGGVLAFEIAVQLQAQGETVAQVALFDSLDVEAPRVDLATTERRNRFMQIFAAEEESNPLKRVSAIASVAFSKVKNLVVYESQNAVRKLANKTRLKLFRYYLDKNLPLPRFLRDISIRTVYEFAEAEYRPQGIFEGELLLFRATVGEEADAPGIAYTSDPMLGWPKRATKGVRAWDVPGNHSSLLQEPNVAQVAKLLANRE